MSRRPLQAAPPAAQIRTAIGQMGRPHAKDAVAGLVTGLNLNPRGNGVRQHRGF